MLTSFRCALNEDPETRADAQTRETTDAARFRDCPSARLNAGEKRVGFDL